MFKELRNCNFTFVCDPCLTRRENNQASCLKEQISDLASTVQTLANDFKSFKEEKVVQSASTNPTPWSDTKRVNKIRSSLCIKSNGGAVNIDKVQELATNNNIQVMKTTTKDNGDLFVDLPSEDNRERLTTLLNDEAFNENQVVNIKSKMPTISILDVKEYSTKEDFIEKVKKQNPVIKQKIEEDSEFSVIFCAKPRNKDNGNNGSFQVVVRVSDDIRKAIKRENDRIYLDLTTKRVVDRFYIKRCNRCQGFGHYEKDCQNEVCCGYCSKSHKSSECKEVAPGDHANYKCINCKRNDKDCSGHSSIWHKCPAYLELQKKLKKTIPFYNSKN